MNNHDYSEGEGYLAEFKILIQENGSLNASELEKKLKLWGYDAIKFDFSGRNIIKKVKNIQPDLILMDNILKDSLDKFERGIITHSNVQVLYLTSNNYGLPSKILNTSESASYLVKPFNDNDLKFVLENAVEKNNIEKRLKKTLNYLQFISDNMIDCIGQLNSKGIIQYVSSSIKKTFGYDPEKLVGKSIFEFLHSDDLDRTLTAFKEDIASNTQTIIQNRFKHYDGHYVWIETVGNPITEDSGKVIGVVFSTRDITNRIEIEKELNEIKNRFQRINSLMNDLISEIDSETNFVYLSPSYNRVLGYNPKELLGKSIFLHIHPEDQRHVIKTFRKVIVSGKSEKIVSRHKHADGHYLWIESIGIPYIDENGNFNGCLITARDITERKKMEDILEFHSQITENLASGVIVVCAADSTIVYTNTMFDVLFGYDKDEIIGQNVVNLFYDDDDESSISTYKTIMDILKREGRWEGELKNVKKNGEIFCSHLIISTFDSHEHGKVWIGVHEDISKRKKMEKALENASKYARNLIEASLDPMVTISPNGKITDVNKATENVTGLNREELIGTDFSEYFTDPDKAKMGYQKALFFGSLQHYPLTIRHSSGNVKQVLYNATVYRNNMGEVEGVFAAAHDVTKLKKARKALKNSERYYRSLIENTLDVIFVLDDEGNVNYASPSIKRVFGYEADDIIGFNVFDFIHPEDLPEILDIFFREIENDASNIRLTVRCQHENGSWLRCKIVAQNLINDPAVNGVVINARDITERYD